MKKTQNEMEIKTEDSIEFLSDLQFYVGILLPPPSPAITTKNKHNHRARMCKCNLLAKTAFIKPTLTPMSGYPAFLIRILKCSQSTCQLTISFYLKF